MWGIAWGTVCLLLLTPGVAALAEGDPPAWEKAPSVEPLPELGQRITRRLAAGERHHYRFRGDGHGLRLTVEQLGLDVVVRVLTADGEVVLAVDSPTGLWRSEALLVPTRAAIDYVVEVRPFDRSSAPGRYRLMAAGAASDPRLAAAERAVTRAGSAYLEATPEAIAAAAAAYREALAHYEALGRHGDAARTLFAQGILQRELRQRDQELDLLRRALQIWQRAGDLGGQAQALMEIASTLRRRGEPQQSEQHYRQALGLWQGLGDLQGQARTLNYLGLSLARSDPGRALAPYEQALERFRLADDRFQAAVVLNNLGGLHNLLGDPLEAMRLYQLALAAHRELGDLRQQGTVRHNMAATLLRSGSLQQALEAFGESLEIRRQLGDRRGEGRVLNSLGIAYQRLGDFGRARAHLQQSLAARRDSGDRRGEATTLHNLGLTEAGEKRWAAAAGFFAQALERRRALGDPGGEASSLMQLGSASGELGRPAEALEHLQQAVEIFEGLENPWRQALALAALGEVTIAAGEPRRAIEPLEHAVRLLREIGDEAEESKALLALGRATLELGEAGSLAQTWQLAGQALELLEPLRTAVDHAGLRATFLSYHAGAAELAVEVAMRRHRLQPEKGWAARALETHERVRARSLLDLLQVSDTVAPIAGDDKLLSRQQALLQRLSAVVEDRRRQLARRGPSPESERLAGVVGEILQRLDDVDREIRRRRPGWGELANPRPLNAAGIRALVDPQTLLLQIALGEERSFLWAVTDRELEVFELPSRQRLESRARQLHESWRILDPSTRDAEHQAALELSQMLLSPIAERLADQRLVIVADGALHYLPFAALPHPAAPSEPLIRRHEVVSLPSASTLAVQRQGMKHRAPADLTLAVLADPVFEATDPRLASGAAEPAVKPAMELARLEPAYRDAAAGTLPLERLPWSRWEAEALASHAAGGDAIDSKPWLALDFAASVDAVRDGRLADYRYLHFATHGIVESERPELSALVFSLYDRDGRRRDGLLRLPEIYHLRLNAELVVLSGCRTALGRELRGEGLVGLTRGFFAAGARRLVASLWRVQDRSTAELMNHLYRRLLSAEDPLPAAAALRAAQLELMSDPRYRDPYHWAAFAVYGDWR
ncbi:MAG: CHAT domain-containing tetratricopeptide repeat protein [Acidobacteriota bacterium]